MNTSNLQYVLMENWQNPILQLSCDARKPFFGISDQVQHKPICITTEDGLRLEILDFDGRGIVSV